MSLSSGFFLCCGSQFREVEKRVNKIERETKVGLALQLRTFIGFFTNMFDTSLTLFEFKFVEFKTNSSWDNYFYCVGEDVRNCIKISSRVLVYSVLNIYLCWQSSNSNFTSKYLSSEFILYFLLIIYLSIRFKGQLYINNSIIISEFI